MPLGWPQKPIVLGCDILSYLPLAASQRLKKKISNFFFVFFIRFVYYGMCGYYLGVIFILCCLRHDNLSCLPLAASIRQKTVTLLRADILKTI